MKKTLFDKISPSNRQRVRSSVDYIANFEPLRKQTRVIGIVGYTLLRRRIFEEMNVDLVIDAGANVGQYAQSVRKFYKGDIVSFEPVPTTFQSLSDNSKDDSRWHCKQCALGSSESTATIHVPVDSVLSSFHRMNSFCESKFSTNADENRDFDVPVHRLDEVLGGIIPDWRDRSIFLKMDTQGYDLEVFKGAGKMMERIVAIQSEVSLIPLYDDMPDWKGCISTFEESGFQLSGLFPVTMEKLSAIELDCLMVKKGEPSPNPAG